MHTHVRRAGDEMIVALDGDADLAAAPRLQQVLQRAIAMASGGVTTLVVDLDGAQVVDDTVLGLIVGAAGGARRAGLDAALICSDERLRQRLADTRIDRILAVRPEPAGDGAGADHDADHEGNVAVIFANRRTGDDDEGYLAMAARMDALAAEQPGYVGIESVRAPSGEGITVSYWTDEAAALAWKQQTEHLEAQAIGRSRWYDRYSVRVATIGREYHHARPIYHLALPADWGMATATGSYAMSTRGVTFDDEGFVHCSFAHQVLGVAQRFYDDVDDLLVLHLDRAALEEHLRIEPAAEGIDELFPHLYRPIPVDAVTEIRPWTRGDAWADLPLDAS